MAFDLNKLKSLFVETSSESQPKTNTEPSSNPPSATVVPEASPAVDTLDSKIVESLLKAISDHNLSGEDYLEFMDALNAMKNIPLDDSMKVKTVMATLSTKGLTIAKINESADYYKKILASEKEQFTEELNNQIEISIKSKQKAIDALKESIMQKSKQIAALTEEINKTQSEITQTESQIKLAEGKIENAQLNFNNAYNFVVEQINQNISKIK